MDEILRRFDLIVNSNHSYHLKLNYLWDLYCIILIIPLFLIFVKRFYNQIPLEEYISKSTESNEKSTRKLPYYVLDNIITLFLAFPIVYYHCDTVIRFYFQIFSNHTEIFVILKNIVVIFLLWNIVRIRYYSWFMIAPVFFYFSKNFFQSKILAFFFYTSTFCCIFGLAQHPWRTRGNYYRSILYISILLFLNFSERIMNRT